MGLRRTHHCTTRSDGSPMLEMCTPYSQAFVSARQTPLFEPADKYFSASQPFAQSSENNIFSDSPDEENVRKDSRVGFGSTRSSVSIRSNLFESPAPVTKSIPLLLGETMAPPPSLPAWNDNDCGSSDLGSSHSQTNLLKRASDVGSSCKLYKMIVTKQVRVAQLKPPPTAPTNHNATFATSC